MLLYHGTTEQKAKMILRDGEIKNYIDRFFAKEKSGNGYTTQGYVTISNYTEQQRELLNSLIWLPIANL